jgi:hypothetical protein
MNSESKLTLNQLKRICLRHNIKLESYSRLTAGFSHELHRINQDLVIKLYNPSNSGSYRTELALLASNLPFKKPTLVAYGEKNEEIDRDYVIMTYVSGTSPGSIWHLATEVQREQLIKEICQSLRTINKINPVVLPHEAVDSWEDLITKRFENLLITLENKNIIATHTINKAQAFFYKNVSTLKDTRLYPVYWDTQFDNFIVNNDFELQAIIDLESLELTSLDYPLCVIQKQINEPEKFLRLEDEKYADKKDYIHLVRYYKKYYPEMFDFKELETRLKVYQELEILNLLIEWSHNKENYKNLDELIS